MGIGKEIHFTAECLNKCGVILLKKCFKQKLHRIKFPTKTL